MTEERTQDYQAEMGGLCIHRAWGPRCSIPWKGESRLHIWITLGVLTMTDLVLTYLRSVRPDAQGAADVPPSLLCSGTFSNITH